MARPIIELYVWVSSVSHNQKLRAILKCCFNWFFEKPGEVVSRVPMAQGGQSHRDRTGFSESLPDRRCFPSLRPSKQLSSWVWQSPGAWHKGRCARRVVFLRCAKMLVFLRCARRLVFLRSQITISTLRAGGLSIFL